MEQRSRMIFNYLLLALGLLFLTILILFYNRRKRSQKVFEENGWFVDLTPKYINKKGYKYGSKNRKTGRA